MRIQNTREFILDLIFPRFCQRCGIEGNYLCLRCQEQISPPVQKCFVCNKPSFCGLTHEKCKNTKTHLTGVLAATDYKKEYVKSLIHHLKFGFVKEISEILGKLLADFLIQEELVHFFEDSLVVPVPLHKWRLKMRGFNQSELIAEVFAKEFGLKFKPLLKKWKPTKPQLKLERKERKKNLKNTFRVKTGSRIWDPGSKILLIDDVISTGTTLNECAKVLKKAGGTETWGLAFSGN